LEPTNHKIDSETQIIRVYYENRDSINVFLNLGRDYLSNLSFEEREKLLKSILARLKEPDRWLFLLMHKDKYVGFIHAKIDKDERPGWGFILELYVVPEKRGMGLGRILYKHVEQILRSRSVKNVWLLTTNKIVPFWRKLGFKLSKERDKETGQLIMTKSL